MPSTKNPAVQLHDELDALRLQVRNLKAKIAAVRNAPASPDEQHAALAGWIDSQAKSFAADMAGQFDGLGTQSLNDFSLLPPVWADTLLPSRLSGLLCFLLRDQLHDKLANLLPHGGTSLDKRLSAIATLETELFSVEVQEEELITQAESFGINLLRRADADPAAILSVEILASEH